MPPPKIPREITIEQVSPRILQIGLLVLAGVWILWTSVYQVPHDSVGIVQRFGKALPDTVQPGLRFKMPFGIDQVSIVPIERQMKEEFGFISDPYARPEPDGLRSASWFGGRVQADQDIEDQRSMVTGDLNAALVEWVVQYRISNPHMYLFHVNEPVRTLRDLSEAVMREVVGDRTVDEVITIGRQEIETEVLRKLQALVEVYELGVSIHQVQLKDVDPPVPVQDSFDEVNKAQQDRAKMVNIATGEYNKIIPRAKGEADQKIRNAEGYRIKRINEAQGDVAAFLAQLQEYVKAPEVTRARLYLETMSEVLLQAGPKLLIDDTVKQVFPLLPGAAAAPANPTPASR